MRKPFDTAVSDLIQSIGMFVRRARTVTPSSEISWTERAVLKHLAREGPATTADLARSQGMRPQSMRTIVATLEHLGFIARKPHPTDGRQVHIELTPKGAAVRKTARAAKRTWLAQAIAQLDKQEQATLFAAGGVIRRLVEL